LLDDNYKPKLKSKAKKTKKTSATESPVSTSSTMAAIKAPEFMTRIRNFNRLLAKANSFPYIRNMDGNAIVVMANDPPDEARA